MHYMLLRRTWLVPTAAVIAACNSAATEPVPVPARDDAPVQTEALDYELR